MHRVLDKIARLRNIVFPFFDRILLETQNLKRSPDGGIGRRARLKIWYSQGCAGSIPVPGTKKNLKSLIFTPLPFKSQ
jgi:hypothetical protein